MQLQPIRFWKYLRGILKVMSFLSSLPARLSFFAGINVREFNSEKYFQGI